MRVIVFALNGCPAGWLGAYGNDWVGTPHLDRLAAEGVTFDRHISDCPEPTAARVAWFGARSEEPNPPAPFPKKEEGAEPRTEDENGTPFSSLSPPSFLGKGAGGLGSAARTILVRANHPDTDAPPSYYAGWGEVFDARPQPDDSSPLDELLRTFPALLDRLADTPDFLLWIETDRLIPPWDVQQDVFEAYLDDAEDGEAVEEESTPGADDDEPEPGDTEEADADNAGVEFVEEFVEEVEDEPDEVVPAVPDEPVPPFADPPVGPFDRSDLDAWDYLHRTFAAVVTKLDAELGRLFDDLRSRGLDRSAAWIVTSDFGLPLGEHGRIGLHRPHLHEELVHLPLILRLPNAEQAGRRVAGFTQPPDLHPTLLALLDAPPAGTPGFNLLPLARGEAVSVREFAVTALELDGASEIAIRTEEWALLVPTRVPEGDPPREPLLFGKPDDRWEVNDLRARNIERADELEARLREEMQKRAAR